MEIFSIENLALFNKIAEFDSRGRASPAISGNERLVDLGLDSMELLVITITFCSFYGVPREVEKAYQPGVNTTVFDFFRFLDQNKTKDRPADDECLAIYKDTCF